MVSARRYAIIENVARHNSSLRGGLMAFDFIAV